MSRLKRLNRRHWKPEIWNGDNPLGSMEKICFGLAWSYRFELHVLAIAWACVY